MGARLRHFWNVLSSSYWFIPLVMMLAAILVAILALEAAVRWPVSGTGWWVYTGGSDGAWAVLSTIAGSVITVGGVAFSITIVTLTQASSQFGPRLLRNFMRDRHNQLVLGTFAATFVYCLMVLRTVRSGEENGFVPHLAITGAVLLALISVGVLVYFIHHTALMLQAPVVAATLGRQLKQAIRQHVRPDDADANGVGSRSEPVPPRDEGGVVGARAQGYLQVLNEGGLLRMAEEHDLTLVLACRPGNFLAEGSELVRVYPGERLSESLADDLRSAFIIGDERTDEQDAAFVIHQLVEVAVRALSPGINDPHTAVTCIDWLGGGIRQVIDGEMRGSARKAADGQVRLFTRAVTFAGLVEAAFEEIREYGAGSASVNGRLLEVLGELGELARTEEQRAALRRQVEHIHAQGLERLAPADRFRLERPYQEALRATALSSVPS